MTDSLSRTRTDTAVSEKDSFCAEKMNRQLAGFRTEMQNSCLRRAQLLCSQHSEVILYSVPYIKANFNKEYADK